MRRGFAIFLVVAFASMLAVGYAQQEPTEERSSNTSPGETTPTTVEETIVMEKTMEPLPKSGGPAVGAMLLPAAALRVGSGVLAYAVLRRR